jgi:hypothetical protein
MRIGQEKLLGYIDYLYQTVEDVMNDRLEHKRMIAGIVVWDRGRGSSRYTEGSTN